MSDIFDNFKDDNFPIIFALRKLSSTEAEKPLLEIPALAAIETTELTGLHVEIEKKIKENQIKLIIFSN